MSDLTVSSWRCPPTSSVPPASARPCPGRSAVCALLRIALHLAALALGLHLVVVEQLAGLIPHKHVLRTSACS